MTPHPRPEPTYKPHPFTPDSGNRWRWCAVCREKQRHPNHTQETHR